MGKGTNCKNKMQEDARPRREASMNTWKEEDIEEEDEEKDDDDEEEEGGRLMGRPTAPLPPPLRTRPTGMSHPKPQNSWFHGGPFVLA
jgi:hypothetical protein